MAAASGDKPGVAGGMYRNTGTYGSPTWTEVTLARDVTAGPGVWDFAESLIRATRAKLFTKTMVDLSSQAAVKADDADAGYVAFFDAACNPSTKLDLLIIDGKITTEGVRGIRAQFLVGADPQNQEIGGVIYTNFQLKPTFSTDGYPKTVSMGAASAPTFTAL